MRYMSVSDIHLGKRQFSATEGGRNQRELDVERAWRAAVDMVVEKRPHLLTVAGDVFEHPRVSGHAIKAWRDGIRRVVQETDATVVVVQGNHDSARTTEVLSPIVIPDDYERVHVVTEPCRVHFQAGAESVAVACLPFVALGELATYRLDPDPDAQINVLLIHAAVNTSAQNVERLPIFYAGDASLDVGLLAEQFDVIAAGDFHDYRRLHPTRAAFYSGSLEYVSSDIWHEAPTKGVVYGDTDTGELELLEIPTRRVTTWQLDDFAEHDGDYLVIDRTARGINAALAELSGMEQVRDAIVRFQVEDFPRGERDQIDWATVRQLKHTCLHFQLDLRFAERQVADLGDRRERSARSLADDALAFFAADPNDVRACALSYLCVEPEAVESTYEQATMDTLLGRPVSSPATIAVGGEQ